MAVTFDNSAIVDEKLLSHPKIQILKSIISIGCMNLHNTELREALKHALLSLSLFQSGIGDTPISNPLARLALDPKAKMIKLDPAKQAEYLSAKEASGEFARWQTAFERANGEAKAYLAIFNERVSQELGKITPGFTNTIKAE